MFVGLDVHLSECCLLAVRFRLLKHTRLNVVAFLNELPKTQHDIASFNVDVNTFTVRSCLFCQHSSLSVSLSVNNFSVFILQNISFLQNTLLSFTVSGVFKEGDLFCHHDFFSSSTAKISSVGLVANVSHLVFQLLLMVNPESPPWLSLEFMSQSRQEILGKFSELPMA